MNEPIAAISDLLAVPDQAPCMIESPSPRLRRWHWLALGVAAVAAIAVPTWLLVGERVKELARWGQPLVVERFDDASWRSRWTEAVPGQFTVRDGRLVSLGDLACTLRFNQRLSGDIAIEYDAEITPDSKPGDVSLFWMPSPTINEWHFPEQGLSIQAGAYDDSFCCIARLPDRDELAHANVRLEPGRRHRVRVEIIGDTVTMAIDGRQVVSHTDQFPLGSGYLALYAYYPGKAFDDVRIFRRDLPEQVSVLGIGDAFYHDDLFAQAAEQYGRVRESHAGTALATRAAYNEGLAWMRAGDSARAWMAWGRVLDEPYREHVACHRIDRLIVDGNHAQAIAEFEPLYAHAPWARQHLRTVWTERVQALSQRRPLPAELERYLDLRARCFADDGASAPVAAGILMRLGRWEEVAERFGDDPRCGWPALFSLGRFEEAMRRYPTVTFVSSQALALLGRPGDIVAGLRHTPMSRAEALLKQERGSEALALAGDDAVILAGLGRADEALAAAGQAPSQISRVLLAAGRFAAVADGDSAVPGSGRDPDRRIDALLLLGRAAELPAGWQAERPWDAWLDAQVRGDPSVAELRLAVVAERENHADLAGWFPRRLLLPWLDAMSSGTTAAWDEALSRVCASERDQYGQRLWHLASLLATRIDEARFLEQPYRAEAAAWLALGQGMRAELTGDRATARAAYGRFTVLPMHRRLLNGMQPDPTVERFVAWRLALLDGR